MMRDRTADTPHDWDDSYAGLPPPWGIGRPQPAFVRLAETGMLIGALLDAGCGTGEHTILAALHGSRALGIDISPRAIEAGRRKAAERRVDANFVNWRDCEADRITTKSSVDGGDLA
jgi:SAM-dependent methyltransferase